MEREEQLELTSVNEQLDGDVQEWEQDRNREREQNNKFYSKKLGRSSKSVQIKHQREEQSKEQRRKRRKYELVEPG